MKKTSVAFGEKSLLLRNMTTGKMYQCIKGKDKLYFICADGGLGGLDIDHIKTDFSDESRFFTDKKDFAINKSDIQCVEYKAKRVENSNLNNSGSIVIRYTTMKKRFEVLDIIEEEKVKEFFSGINLKAKSKKENKEKNKKLDNFMGNNVQIHRDLALVARLNRVVTILKVISVMASAIFIFFKLNYTVMSLLCMSLFITFVVLYIKYNDILSMNDSKRRTRETRGKIKISSSLIILIFGLELRSLLDFTYVSYEPFLIWSTVVFVLLLFIFFRYTEEYKRDKTAIIAIIAVSLFFAISSVPQINYILDYSKAQLTESKVQDMHVTKDSKSGISYYINAAISSGKVLEIRVPSEYYKQLSVGEKITISERQGFLKIPYVRVKQNQVY